jgi:AcrR family transcriptional regulator
LARRKDQAAARAAIVDAALIAVRDRGVAELRIADVAAVAGVSTGTVHYYFGDFTNLSREVHRLASDRFFAQRLSAVTQLADARHRLSSMIATGLPRSSDDALVTALYYLGAHMGFRNDHSALSSGLFDKQVALYVGTLEYGVAQGVFRLDEPVVDVATNLVALEDAYALHIIDATPALSYPRAVSLICSFARTATGCADISPVFDGASDAGVDRRGSRGKGRMS